MDIVILKNGAKHGPFSETNVISFLKSGRLSQSDLAWREGQDGWKPLSDLLGPALADVPLPPADSVRSSQKASGAYSNNEILRIARLQKMLIWVVVASLIVFLNRYAGFAIAIATAVFLFRLARALRRPAWFFAIGAFVPLLSTILLVGLNMDATATLRKYGIRVGLIGANPRDLDRLKAPQSSPA
jgi:hypothetical protein